MEPFTPDDPLWKLMSKARPGGVRQDFAQKVVRAARQEAQDIGWWMQVRDWMAGWQRPLRIAAAAAAVVVVFCLGLNRGGRPSGPPVLAVADADIADIADEDFSIPLGSLDHMDALVAREDTSSLTDAEIQYLLY